MGRHATAFQELFMDEDGDVENDEDMDDDVKKTNEAWKSELMIFRNLLLEK